MTDFELIKKEEERLNKKYQQWDDIEKINFIINNSYKNYYSDLNQLILRLNTDITNTLNANLKISDSEYGYITFNQLISLMKINCDSNLKDSNFRSLASLYSKLIVLAMFENYKVRLSAILLEKSENSVDIKMNYGYRDFNFLYPNRSAIKIKRNSDTNNCYFEGYDFSQKEENNLVSTLNLDSIYNFFNNSDADVFINGIYNNNNGVNIDVPIKITNTSVMIGNSDTFNKYGICYCYSVLKNNIIKVIHKPSSADDKYNMIRSIYINDKDFKNNLLININDLPMQYLKYLDCLYKVEENNKLDSGNKGKGKIKNLFKKMKKNS